MKLMLSLLLFATNAFALRPIDNTRLIVKTKPGHIIESNELIKSTKHLFKNLYIVTTSDAKKLQAALESDKGIDSTQLNYKSQKGELMERHFFTESTIKLNPELNTSAFNDPMLSRVWSFNDAEQNGISVNKAYLSRRSNPVEEIIVAVVDTGVDYNHDDLKNVMWKNPGEIAGNGLDDDDNGYVDDVYGIDTLERDAQGNATGDPMDPHSHGTHVSGTIAAEQNNNIGIAGIASNVKIMAIRAVPSRGDETDADVAESFLYAAKNGAKIINCSFGKRVNEGGLLVFETIKHIGDEYGVLIIAAAGNESSDIDRSMRYPASFANEHLLVVAATTRRGSFAYFSNYGVVNVDVAAPGSNILSTTPNNNYATYSGTSMASPTTAGLAAELLANRPELGPLELKQAIMDSVNIRSSLSRVKTSGLIDLEKALSL